MNIYVGNLSFDTTEDTLREIFAKFGEVSSVNIIMDRDTGRPRGFGFVEMSDGDAATAAINGLNSTEMDGRTLNVNEARQRTERDNRGGGGGGGRGGRGGGGNRRNNW